MISLSGLGHDLWISQASIAGLLAYRPADLSKDGFLSGRVCADSRAAATGTTVALPP